MEIAVIGGGHGAYAAAADLSEAGHNVRLCRRDEAALAPLLESGAITLKDHCGERRVRIGVPTADLARALDGAELVVVPLPATAQHELFHQMAPHLREGQVVLIAPGTFGTYILAKAMRAAGNNAKVAFAETPTLPWFARKHGPATVAVSGRTVELPTGVLPSRLTDQAIAVIQRALPAVVPAKDALDVVLLNGGPMIHPALILMNAGAIEHFDRWDIHKEGTQPAIRAVHDAFDAERIAVREALGYRAPHWTLAEYYGEGVERRSMYGEFAHIKLTDSGDWREKIDLRTHRYMREDIQLGLVLMASVGRFAGVPMPVANGLIALASAVTGDDLVAKGRSLANLGIGDLSRAEMAALLRDGPAQ